MQKTLLLLFMLSSYLGIQAQSQEGWRLCLRAMTQ